jgi:hypothetical protein
MRNYENYDCEFSLKKEKMQDATGHEAYNPIKDLAYAKEL